LTPARSSFHSRNKAEVERSSGVDEDGVCEASIARRAPARFRYDRWKAGGRLFLAPYLSRLFLPDRQRVEKASPRRPATQGSEVAVDEDERTRDARAARNQALYRAVNERVKELNEAFDAFLTLGDWVCECASEECFEQVQMTHEEYEAVRAGGARFFVTPDEGHVFPEVEQVTERHERYWVVEKVGAAATIVERQDPQISR
jgi:hypothetical protein